VTLKALMIKYLEYGVKTDKSQAMSLSLEPQVLIIDKPESVVEVVSSVIGDDLIQLLTEQSKCKKKKKKKKKKKWKVSPKTLKWSSITPEVVQYHT